MCIRDRFSERSLTVFAHQLKSNNLTTLSFSKCRKFGSAGFGNLVNSPNISSLKSLDLSWTEVEDTDLHKLGEAKYLKSLVTLKLRRCESLTDTGFQALFTSPNMQSLRNLKLPSCRIGNYGLKLLSESIYMMGICDLNLEKCSRIDDNGFKLFFLFKNSANLTKLTLTDTLIADDGLVSIAVSPYLTRLQKLVLEGCSKLTDEGFKKFFNKANLRALQTLVLSSTAIQNDGLYSLASSSTVCILQDLRLEHCVKITDSGFAMLFNSAIMITIRKINVSSTNIDFGAFNYLMKSSTVKRLSCLEMRDCPLLGEIRKGALLPNLQGKSIHILAQDMNADELILYWVVGSCQ
eukprot:TRINITY_DN14329_c0_g1_i2.p1 TRINITY_DN14329_c0_g1~~TRINITY_DN14329_c0_g1_i2.p1  ORF type:complete len:350 (+),score=15.08 TRINITY_DN14329_c0_g1_i2:65-1114(+)